MTNPIQTEETAPPALGLLRPSRRSVIVKAGKLAIAAPLALAALPSIAAAKGGDDHGPDHHEPDDDDREQHGALEPDDDGSRLRIPPGQVNARFTRRLFELTPVGAVNGGSGGADFTATSAGSDALASGAVFLAGNRQAVLFLRGAAASASYEVFFERFQDHGREDLGAVTTDARGNANGPAPNTLGGSNRVGVFVVARGGSDEFVSTLA